MIRNATPADLPRIRCLMESEPGFLKETPRDDALEQELRSADDLALVWEQDDEVLGFLCAHDLGFRAYLSELIVAEAVRSQGIGRKLVLHVQNELRNRGCLVLFAGVWRSTEGFYRSLGWSEPDVTLLRKRLLDNA